CGRPAFSALRITGGGESLPGRWPWMAATFMNIGGIEEYICGGSLIGPRHILTAAHCTIMNRNISKFNSGSSIHEEVERSHYVMPLCLPPPSARFETFAHMKATVAGWGQTSHDGGISAVLREVQIPVWLNDDCNPYYSVLINSSFVCAGQKEGRGSSYIGDSGGPLMLEYDGRWIQIGIVSFGRIFNYPYVPGVIAIANSIL
ncbi:hypothetical protein L9F63_009155, partial [Diploptera punctata]